ncbi:IucA/IucC family protein [Streptomyces pathocidini]|uniref:IucA/IucC family protein n=1 Tax=Streptomyces pathocidini TaxID=1650571 RepID=A0ABW7UIS2_9ACTN|nr:IucA/IucC family protein [Streptomyces pathocidini]
MNVRTGGESAAITVEPALPRPSGLSETCRTTLPDPLDDPDPRAAAEAAGTENLLRCWVRENSTPPPGGDTLRIPLPASGTALLVPVHYWSATGCHRFGAPALESGPLDAPAADAVTVAALLGREAAPAASAGQIEGAARGGVPAGDGTDLVGRVADSVRRTAEFIADRRASPAVPITGDLFLDAEQSLVLGHPLHPTPKSREGLSETELRAYSPELRGAFPLHWMAVDRSVLATDSAWTESGRSVPAEQLLADLAGGGLELPGGAAPLPLHPWQARELCHRPEVAELLDAGLLHDLGPHGAPWHPTSSVRTVHRPGAAAMLKLSLGLRITNSRRENLRKELQRGVEVHRLLCGGLAEQWQRVHPRFDIVRDPAWIAVSLPGGEPVPGLDAVIRHNPFGPGDDVACVAGLTSPRPWPADPVASEIAATADTAGLPKAPGALGPGSLGSGAPGPEAAGPAAGMRSRLADVVRRLADRTGRPVGAVSAEWFLRYLEAVVRPILWFDGEAGIALEAHQQNTLVLLDADGWPAGGRYRDNQGYYFRESHRDALGRRLPGIGVESDTFVPDEVTDERFAYYLGINNVLGLIGAFGAQGLADERLLIAAFRRFLSEVATGPGRTCSPLPALLLDSTTLRCKANLLTRLHGLDELVGPVADQSVYVTISNPLALPAA